MKAENIQELLNRVNHLLKNKGATELSKIEFDLLMQSLRDLYAQLDEARNTPATNQQKGEVTYTAPVIKRTLNPNQNLLVPETEKQKQPVVVEPVKPKKEEPVVKQHEKAEAKHKDSSVKSSINESVSSSSTLNEKHKASPGEVHKKLSTKPLKDLIDLNKKFTLLNDLFKGNSEAFAAAIRHIETLPSYGDAESFIKNELSSNYFWDEKSQSVRMFIKLVKQKFGEE